MDLPTSAGSSRRAGPWTQTFRIRDGRRRETQTGLGGPVEGTPADFASLESVSHESTPGSPVRRGRRDRDVVSSRWKTLSGCLPTRSFLLVTNVKVISVILSKCLKISK